MKSLLFVLFLAISCQVSAQVDTSAYQTQRLKVNALLNQRSAKFGQYDQSLDTRTGIFGPMKYFVKLFSTTIISLKN
jgi:hypothetical protein